MGTLVLLSALGGAGAFCISSVIERHHRERQHCADQGGTSGSADCTTTNSTDEEAPALLLNSDSVCPLTHEEQPPEPPELGVSDGAPLTTKRRRRAAACLFGAVAVPLVTWGAPLAAWLVLRRPSHSMGWRKGARSRDSMTSAEDGPDSGRRRLSRVPLPDVVRFKERQWFLEELEASKGGDANSMLRLAKQYLHGQGCERSAATAQDWLRKARANGLYCTLDELYAGDDLRREVTEQALRERRRRAATAAASGPTPGMTPQLGGRGSLPPQPR